MTSYSVQAFETASGAQILQIPLQAFPGFWVYAYLVKTGDYFVLIDSGSGYGNSNADLSSGFQTTGELWGDQLGWQNLTHIFLTHAHIDHFGGLGYVRERTSALLGVHELDRRVLTNYEERLTLISRRLDSFLVEAGVSTAQRPQLIEMYRFTKNLFRSVSVDFTYEAIDMQLGPFEFFHVPGHAAGHVAIRLSDVVFCGDHVLNEISPHQAPEHLTLNTGLSHYLHSLDRFADWAGTPRLVLGGHKAPITNLPARIKEIKQEHATRLERILEILAQPLTITEVSRQLFKEVSGYNVLLALEETGAHIEYLYQRGLLGIANLTDVSAESAPIPQPIPFRYCRLDNISR